MTAPLLPDPTQITLGRSKRKREFSASALPDPSKITLGGAGSGVDGVGPIQKIAGGLLRGLREDPITGFFVDRVVEQFPEATEDAISRFTHQVKGSTLADVFSLLGEFGPSLAMGVGAFGLGRKAAVSGLSHLGKGKGLGSTLGRVAERQLPHAEQVAKFTHEELLSLAIKPTLERGAMVVGGSTGLGAYVGTAELFDGAPIGDAAKAALTTAALAGVFEGAIWGLASLPVVGIKTAKDPAGLLAWYKKTAAPLIAKERSKLKTQADKVTLEINELLGVNGQQRELFKAVDLQGKSAVRPGKAGLGEKGEKILGPLEQAEKKTQTLKQMETRIKSLDDLAESPMGFYTRGAPYNPKGFFEVLAKARLQMIQTPESFKGQLGRTMLKFFEQVDDAERLTTVRTEMSRMHLDTMAGGLAQILGFSRKQRMDTSNLGPIFNAWEKYGEVGVQTFLKNLGKGQHADEAVKMFQSYDKGMMEAYNQLVKMGAEPALAQADLAKMGVSKYLPHILDDLGEQNLVARFAETMGERKAQEFFNKTFRKGFSRFGSIDFQRKYPGSLAEKVMGKLQKNGEWKQGLPFNRDPIDASLRYMSQVHRRINYGQRFGMKGESLQVIRSAAVAEGANRALVTSLTDLALGPRYYDAAMRQLAQTATGLQIASKLGLAVIPNMSQSINTIVFGGLTKFAKGLTHLTKKENRTDVIQSVGLMESIVTGMGKTFGQDLFGASAKATIAQGGRLAQTASLMDDFAHMTLRYSGFSSVEKWNRVMAGATGYQVVRDTVAKALTGRLKGNTLDTARRRMQSLGVDLDQTVRLATKHGDDWLQSAAGLDVMKKAMFKASTLTQFNPNILRKPVLWNHPVGRVMAQFKTFALGQGRFIRDQIFAEAKQGNLKPMAYFLSIYPMAGEVIAETKAAVRFKDRKTWGTSGDDDIDRIIQDFTMVGGLGILSDMWTSARFGKPLEGVFGPTGGDASELLVNLAQGQPGAMLNTVLDTPTADAVVFGATAAGWSVGAMLDYADKVLEDETTGRTIVDLGVLRTQPKR